jgi:hypothetical protein
MKNNLIKKKQKKMCEIPVEHCEAGDELESHNEEREEEEEAQEQN